MRRAAKVDANHSAVVRAFRECGASVEDLSRVGHGCPDLAVGILGVTVLVEVKDGDKSPSSSKLTPAQAIWHRDWRGAKAIVRSPHDARELVNRFREVKCL